MPVGPMSPVQGPPSGYLTPALQVVADVGASFHPWIETPRDIIEPVSGKNAVTGDELGVLDRILTGGAMAVPFIGGSLLRDGIDVLRYIGDMPTFRKAIDQIKRGGEIDPDYLAILGKERGIESMAQTYGKDMSDKARLRQVDTAPTTSEEQEFLDLIEKRRLDDYLLDYDPGRREGAKGMMANVKRTSPENLKKFVGRTKAVYPDGSPQPMYHATHRGRIDSYSRGFAGQGGAHPAGNLGFFFSSDPKVARKIVGGKNPTILEDYIRVERPYEMSMEQLVKLHYSGLTANDFIQTREGLKKQGFDGIHIKADPGFSDVLPDADADVWIIFFPEQAKSVSNVGTFSRQSKHRLYGALPLVPLWPAGSLGRQDYEYDPHTDR